jgi:hypothetical protein
MTVWALALKLTGNADRSNYYGTKGLPEDRSNYYGTRGLWADKSNYYGTRGLPEERSEDKSED